MMSASDVGVQDVYTPALYSHSVGEGGFSDTRAVVIAHSPRCYGGLR